MKHTDIFVDGTTVYCKSFALWNGKRRGNRNTL